jgi:hypothetical protein
MVKTLTFLTPSIKLDRLDKRHTFRASVMLKRPVNTVEIYAHGSTENKALSNLSRLLKNSTIKLINTKR